MEKACGIDAESPTDADGPAARPASFLQGQARASYGRDDACGRALATPIT
jgi:hypothetical protein